MTRDPYRHAKGVFWVIDNSSSHRGQASIDRLDAFEHHYNKIATPFHWTFTREDFEALIARAGRHEPRLRLVT
jgi:hypothetical protein